MRRPDAPGRAGVLGAVGRAVQDPASTVPLAVSALYVAVVVWAAAYHEPWRDEVVPLSIARSARSLTELAEPLKFEGHPILWYLLLWCADGLIGNTVVLKVVSLAASVGAIVLLTRCAMPWWLRFSFTFSFLPIYQYSVISRGYSVGMLALFAFCALYPHRREHPVALAFTLAALANTAAYGFIMAVAAAVMLVVDGLGRNVDRRGAVSDRWVQAAVAVYVGGLVLAAIVAVPDSSHRGIAVRHFDPWSIAGGVFLATVQPAFFADQITILPAPSLWVWGYFVYLVRRPALLSFTAGSLIGLQSLFNLAHGNVGTWHIGQVVLVLIAAMWLDASRSTASCTLPASMERVWSWLGRVLAAGVTVALVWQMWLGVQNLNLDFRYDYSSNRRLAEVLGREPALANAVVMGEPDPPLWSLPYYAENRIYLAREDVFRDWGMFGPARRASYDLDALLVAARQVREGCACPVVITLGWDIDTVGTHANFRGTRFEEHFGITPEARAQFLAATQLLARLRGPTLTDERYDVYVLR